MNRLPSRTERLRRLARALCLTPGSAGLRCERHGDKWWLVGCIEGDQPLIMAVVGEATVDEAIARAEAWMVSEQVWA